MDEILYEEIPSLDLASFYSGDPDKKKQFVADLGAAFHSIGFIALRNHFLTPEIQEKLLRSARLRR
jgi:isopenicillin N synthase-like dioxygenase